MAASVFLTRLCVSIEKDGPCGVENKGALEGRGNFLKRVFRADTGHNGELPRGGIWTVANWEVA